MDGFTPTFFLQLFIAIASGGVAYGAIRADLAEQKRRIDEEVRLREKLEESLHGVRSHVNTLGLKVASIEGRQHQ